MNMNHILTFVTILAIIAAIASLLWQLFSDNKSSTLQSEMGTDYADQNDQTRNKYARKKQSSYRRSENHGFLLGLGTFILVIATFSPLYNILPFICTMLLLFTIIKNSKYQTFKIRWLILNLFLLLLIFSTLFLPGEITSIFNAVGPIQLQNFPALLNWLLTPFNLLKNIFLTDFWGATQIILISRSLFYGYFIYHFAKALFNPDSSNTDEKSKFFSMLLLLIIFGITLHANIFWPMIISVYTSIKLWFFPVQ